MTHTEAYLNGWHAHAMGLVTDNNPYNEGSQKFSYHQWESGWCARFGAIKHGEDLSLDGELFL